MTLRAAELDGVASHYVDAYNIKKFNIFEHVSHARLCIYILPFRCADSAIAC